MLQSLDNRSSIFQIGKYTFPINEAYFYFGTFETQSYGGKHVEMEQGWTFQIATDENENLTFRHRLYGAKPTVYSEYDPIPLEDTADLTGTKIFLKDGWNKEKNLPYLSLYVWEHGDLYNISLNFIKKQDNFYWLEIQAMIPANVLFANPTRLTIKTWIEKRPST